MCDDLEELRADTNLLSLLDHYASLALPDRLAWQDRKMPSAEEDGTHFTQLHGRLIAFGWLEQNTGMTPVLLKGGAPACYRITPAGLRALRHVRSAELEAA